MAAELNIITHTYDLLNWTLRHVVKFPRAHLHGLGRRIEDKLYDISDLLVEAKFTGDKAEILRRAAFRVEQLRLLYRSAADQGVLPLKSQHYAVERLQEIGRELGGWRRSIQKK
jgi:hypothetical protein